MLVKTDEHALILLQTNHDSSSIFADYVRRGQAPTVPASTSADGNVVDAIRECEEFVEEWRSDDDLLELVAILKNRLSMIYHELTDEAAVYRVFEVLNSRGLDVKWIDKLKSQLMGLIFEHTKGENRKEVLTEMREIWKDIYRILGLRGSLGDDALRFAGTLKSNARPNRLLSLEKSAETLAEMAGTEAKSIVATAQWLKQVVTAVDRIDRDVRLSAVTKIVHARFLAASIFLRKFPEVKESETLKLWENTTFRIYGIGRKDSRFKVGEYIRAAYDINNTKMSSKATAAALKEIGSDFSIENVFENNDWGDCYEGWTEELRYLLFRYDEHLAHEAGETLNNSQWNKIWNDEPSKSIEHITPQSLAHDYVHQLGNLVMLPPGVNSSLRNKPPKDKASTYIACGIRSTAEVGTTIQRSSGNRWNKASVNLRTKNMLAFIRAEWL